MKDELDTMLSKCKIGEPTTLILDYVEQNIMVSTELVKQARYSLDIVSRDLEHKIYDNADFINAVKDLALSDPKVKIRVLIQNSDKAVKQGHRLVELSRKLTSFIDIRIQGKRFKEFNEAWLIVDSKAWIRRAHADEYHAEVDCSAARKLREIGESFNNMWNEASHDPNLRRLSL